MKTPRALLSGVVWLCCLLPLMATTPAFPVYDSPAPGTDPLYDAATFEKLQTLKADVHWDNISVQAALKDLTSQSKRVDPTHLGVKFIFQGPGIPEGKVSILITGASLFQALEYLIDQTGFRLKMTVHKNEVILSRSDPSNPKQPSPL